MLKLILISLLVTVPLGYFLTDLWLNGFMYHININVIPFIIVAFVGVLATVIIVSVRSIKAASKNPVDSLRSE
jgi:putative ABC transport system permease protein